jgi:hypothetical protein
LAFAGYSVTVVGKRRQNITGIAALVLSLLVVLPTLLGSWVVIQWFGYAIALIIQEIGGLLGSIFG